MAAPDVPPITIPDAFTVWAASDLHGQRRAVDRLLGTAGLTDGADRWIAPAGTGLVITGDVVDRGPDSLGLVRRLVSLREQAAAAGSVVAILEGNHEVQVLAGLDGQPDIFPALMSFGGGATLQSVGMRPAEWADRPAAELRARVDELAPDLLPALWTFAPYARWRDVVFVHGGPVPDEDLETWGSHANRLWIREAFFDSPDPFPDAEPWAAYRDAGIRRVVFGHTPVEQPTFSHDGRAVDIDTWRGRVVTLARVAPDGDLRGSTFLTEPAEPRLLAEVPVSPEEIRRFDTNLPAVVDTWLANKFRRGHAG